MPKEDVEEFNKMIGGVEHLIKDENETHEKLEEVRKDKLDEFDEYLNF